MSTDEVLRAIAHPGRRAMLRLVWTGERPATELAEAAGLSHRTLTPARVRAPQGRGADVGGAAAAAGGGAMVLAAEAAAAGAVTGDVALVVGAAEVVAAGMVVVVVATGAVATTVGAVAGTVAEVLGGVAGEVAGGVVGGLELATTDGADATDATDATGAGVGVGTTTTIDGRGMEVGGAEVTTTVVEAIRLSSARASASCFSRSSTLVLSSASRLAASSVRSRSRDSRSEDRMLSVAAPMPAVAVRMAPARIA